MLACIATAIVVVLLLIEGGANAQSFDSAIVVHEFFTGTQYVIYSSYTCFTFAPMMIQSCSASGCLLKTFVAPGCSFGDSNGTTFAQPGTSYRLGDGSTYYLYPAMASSVQVNVYGGSDYSCKQQPIATAQVRGGACTEIKVGNNWAYLTAVCANINYGGEKVYFNYYAGGGYHPKPCPWLSNSRALQPSYDQTWPGNCGNTGPFGYNNKKFSCSTYMKKLNLTKK